MSVERRGERRVKHAIVLAPWNWCEAAKRGLVKIYQFHKRRVGIRALSRGSICVVLAKAGRGRKRAFYGEFEVTEVKEVTSKEYSKLVDLIYEPEKLKPGEKRWIIAFEKFIEYPRKLSPSELADIKTSTSSKPISQWVITGLTYIDEQALEALRRKAGYTPPQRLLESADIQVIAKRVRELEERISHIEALLGLQSWSVYTHECVEMMLLQIGKDLGYRTYTADPSKSCTGKLLKELTTMSKEDLKEYAPPAIFEDLCRVDVVWYGEEERELYAFEVVLGSSIRDSLIRLAQVGGPINNLYIVSDKNRREEFRREIRKAPFSKIRHTCKFLTFDEIMRIYTLTRLWKQAVKPLSLHTN